MEVPIVELEKATLLDYPGRVACILFTYGCNLRCPYCHNPELVTERLSVDTFLTQEYIFGFLKRRVGKLDAVVITGGEPLIHNGIFELLSDIKKMGYLVKLDSNGLLPDKLKKVIDSGNVDYVAMDIKYPLSEYMNNVPNSSKLIQKSVNLIMNSGLDYEFRTTYVKGIHTIDSAEQIAKIVQGAKIYYIQNFRPGKSIDPALDRTNSFTRKELKEIKKIASKYVKNVFIRE